ncbi:alpha/beta fold hydrolase [Pseudomonas sp. B392_1p]|uniref:alpha/beta fold hydrolase n=1 Tax=Pseudomonas sp. B392_1p TaxID=3457507 RepID=UPI003FD03C7A
MHETSPSSEPPIVLFHDSLGCVELWRDFPEKLCMASGRTVIAYDRLGFGRSDVHPGGWTARFIRDEAERYFPRVKDALGIGTFVAFGHSVGGGIAAHCAAHMPEQCQFLVTESAQAFVEDRTLQGIRAAEAAFQAPGQLERLKKYHGEKAQWVLQAWTRTWQSEAMRNWDLQGAIHSIGCPTLVIHGELDEYGSERHAQRIGTLAGDLAHVLLIENCGHVPHREREELVLKTVAQFLLNDGLLL